MLDVMLRAFVGAGLADVSAEAANGLGCRAVARHCSGCKLTSCCAIHIKCNAFSHHFDVGFCETGYGAVVAGSCAVIAGLNAGGKYFKGHSDLLYLAKPSVEGR